MNCYPALPRTRITPQSAITSATDKTIAFFPHLGCACAVHSPYQANQACHGNDRQFVKHCFLCRICNRLGYAQRVLSPKVKGGAPGHVTA
jgi:hypothetical protein